MPGRFTLPRFLPILIIWVCLWTPVNSLPAPAAPPEASPAVESYYWPPGFFLQFNTLKQAQKEMMLAEVAKKLTTVHQSGKGLLVRGDLLDKVGPDVAQLNPATILDQSGMVVRVRNFPNIFFNYKGPATLISKSTFLVLKNPQVDRVESILRQSLVINGDFFAFSQAYITSTMDKLNKALPGSTSQKPLPGMEMEQPPKGKKRP